MKLTTKNLDLLIEEATIDCYDEYECRVGFLTMIQDNLDTPFKAKLKKREVAVVEIDGDDRIIKAVICEGKISYTVDILDLDIDHKVKGSEWFAAYRKWETEK